MICSLNFYPNTHSLTVSCSSTLFLHFFSVFPPSSQSPSSFNSLFSLSPSDFFDILWIMLWAILCGFSQDLFSIFFAGFHLIRRCYQPPTSQYFLLNVFHRSSRRTFRVYLSMISAMFLSSTTPQYLFFTICPTSSFFLLQMSSRIIPFYLCKVLFKFKFK